METILFPMLLTFLLLSHRKFKIKPLLLFEGKGKQTKATGSIATIKI